MLKGLQNITQKVFDKLFAAQHESRVEQMKASDILEVVVYKYASKMLEQLEK